MKLNWHTVAARVSAANPHWTWSQVCAAVGKRKRAKVARPTVQAYAARMNQMKLL